MSGRTLIINEKDLAGTRRNEHEPYDFTRYEVTPRAEFTQCYTALYELPPLKSNFPYHYHAANTEVFYIISGQGVMRTPEGDRHIKAGDFIVCPPSAAGAHKITNTSEVETLRYIDFDTTVSPDVVTYPDSNKTGVIIRNVSSTFFRNDSSTDYYDGE